MNSFAWSAFCICCALASFVHELHKLSNGLREELPKELMYVRKNIRFHIQGVVVHVALIAFVLYLSRHDIRRDIMFLLIILSNAFGTSIRHGVMYVRTRRELPLAQIRDVMEK